MATPPLKRSIRALWQRFISTWTTPNRTVLNLKTQLKGQKIALYVCAFALALTAVGTTAALSPQLTKASDHDDGDIDVRSRALSLTDLYAFREIDQNPSAKSDDLILVMNTNPRSVARQQYFFSNEARYEFRFSQVTNKDATPTAKTDQILRFTFSPPSGIPRKQTMAVELVDSKGTAKATTTTDKKAIQTTPLTTASTPTLNQISLRGVNLQVFAGLREDPFFFDVEQFFRVRAGLVGKGPSVGFRSPQTALDFTKGYNVNTIVVRVPLRLLKDTMKTSAFDVWLSLQVKDPRTGQFTQTEQLARPGVNEALLVSQPKLAAYNRLEPTRTVTPVLAGIATEAKQTLRALGNSDTRANALLGAFLPDVMRIDTTGASGYANALNAKGAPIRGRLLKDDVIDITLSVLTNGGVTTDNVSYEGASGNPGQGHQPLVSSFPYLAPPN